MKRIEYVIVGGGVAGCVLAFELIKRQKKVLLFDELEIRGSSNIAAGLINPITGRHFVKSWKINALLEAADNCYSPLEQEYDVLIQHNLKVIRALKSPSLINEWSARELDDEYESFIYNAPFELNKSIDTQGTKFGIIQEAKRINFEALILLSRNIIPIQSERFDVQKVVHEDGHMKYGDLRFKHLIFCEGAEVRNNPLWNWLPFVPAKGERLVIHSPDLQLKDVYNDGKIIIPLDNNQYWVGSNYEWNELDTRPTEKEKQNLIDFLDKTINVPYDIIDHSAHIRPSTYNRRPFVGRHPKHPNYYILNGLGAKGASLAPYCVEQLLGYIFNGSDLDPEIDIRRVLEL